MVELLDRALVGVGGECAFRCPIGCGVKKLDCVCYPCLSGCHAYKIGCHRIGDEGKDEGYQWGGDSGCSDGQRTSDTIEIDFALFLQGGAFFLEPDLCWCERMNVIRRGWGVTHALNFASSSANSWSTVRSI